MISKKEPKDFSSRFSIVSCFCEHDGRFILLYRPESKSQGLTWGVPAGKVDENESKEDAIVREIKEETGLEIEKAKVKYFGKVYVRYSDYDFIYHIFHIDLSEKPEIKINNSEHLDFTWVTPNEALSLPLIEDLDACIKLFYNIQ